jgi:hypothetical protein
VVPVGETILVEFDTTEALFHVCHFYAKALHRLEHLEARACARFLHNAVFDSPLQVIHLISSYFPWSLLIAFVPQNKNVGLREDRVLGDQVVPLGYIREGLVVVEVKDQDEAVRLPLQEILKRSNTYL